MPAADVLDAAIPLTESVLALAGRRDDALADWFPIGDSVSPLRVCLEDPEDDSLTAALLVHDAELRLSDGDEVPLDERLLATGGVDIDGREGALPATALSMPRIPRGAVTAMTGSRRSPISAAARLSRNGDAAFILVGVAPHPIQARQIESLVRGRTLDERIIDLAAQTARSEAQPYGVGEVTDAETLASVEDCVRRLLNLLRDWLE